MERRDLKKDYKKQKKNLKKTYGHDKTLLRKDYYERVGSLTDEAGNKAVINPPLRPGLEEIGNSVTHLTGAVFSVVALILMCIYSDGALETVGAVIYFFGLFVMFTNSCLYHAFPYGSTVKRLFRRFDYSSIYLLIGATFAPILLSYVGGTLGLVYLIIQWLVIATGITFVGVFGPTRLRFVHIPLYVILGWCGLVFIPRMINAGDYGFLALILGGGVIYSLGIIPFVLKKRVAHFIWHFFVLAGAVVQWIGVFSRIYLK